MKLVANLTLASLCQAMDPWPGRAYALSLTESATPCNALRQRKGNGQT